MSSMNVRSHLSLLLLAIVAFGHRLLSLSLSLSLYGDGTDVPKSFLDVAVLVPAMARTHLDCDSGGRSRGEGFECWRHSFIHSTGRGQGIGRKISFYFPSVPWSRVGAMSIADNEIFSYSGCQKVRVSKVAGPAAINKVQYKGGGNSDCQ